MRRELWAIERNMNGTPCCLVIVSLVIVYRCVVPVLVLWGWGVLQSAHLRTDITKKKTGTVDERAVKRGPME